MKRVSTIIIALAAVVLAGVPAWAGNNAVPENPTFNKDIAPILNANCVGCHRPGEIGPMSLMSYDEVRPWAKSIQQAVQNRVMPPWHADAGFGPWRNERALQPAEIETIVKWVDTGATAGNPSDLPPVPEFGADGWALGKPDYEFAFEAVDVQGGGPDQFRNLEHKTNFDEDMWVKAVEIRPSNRKVVHHVILWQGGQSAGGWLEAWAAGNQPKAFPEGTGRLLKKGMSIVGDMHYHPTEESASDVTRVGLHFAKAEDIKKELINLWVMNGGIEIPAGDANYEALATHTFDQDSHVLSLTPHMHYRGKDFSYKATFPDGTTRDLLKVSKYDFNWQTTYEFAEPLNAPKGTRIDCVAHWDNSTANLANPDPNKTVRFGNESTDEMMIGFLDYVVDDGVRPVQKASPVDPKIKELAGQFPGEVFVVEIPNNGSLQRSALHIPRQGEGGWYVAFGNTVGKARVFDIVWTGESFEAKLAIPGQAEQAIKGTIKNEGALADLKLLAAEGVELPLVGERASQ